MPVHMQHRYYRSVWIQIISSVLVLQIFCFGSAFAAERLTDEMVRDTLDTVDRATAQQDLDTVRKYLSEDFRLHMSAPSLQEPYELDVHQYMGHLARAYELVKDYSFKRKDVDIKVADDGQTASSTSQILEFLTLKEERLSFVTNQIIFYSLQSDHAVITTIDATIEDIHDDETNAL